MPIIPISEISLILMLLCKNSKIPNDMANLNKISEKYKQKPFLLIVLFNFQVPIDSLPAENKFLFLELEYRGFPFPRPYMIYYNYFVSILYRAKTMSNNNHSLSLIKTIKVFDSNVKSQAAIFGQVHSCLP